MNEDIEDIKKHIESFCKTDDLTDIILLGMSGDIRRIQIGEEDER